MTAKFSLISDKKFRELYSTMLKYRILEAHARTIVRGLPSIRGQEAAIAGAAVDLRRGDTVFSADGVTGSYLQDSKSSKLFEHLHARPQMRKTHVSKPPGLEAQIGIATGSALAGNRKHGSITLAFLTDTAGHLDAVRDSLAFASANKLPIIYLRTVPEVKENITPSFGELPVIPVDANDVVAVYRVAYECTLRARQGGGPSVIECRTFTAKQQDPIRSMEQYLDAKGLFSQQWKQQLIQSFEKDVKRAMSEAKKTTRKRSNTSVQTENPFLNFL